MSEFGRYTLLHRVGKGGMAEIWKASASGPGGFEKILAIKVVLPEFADDADFTAMFAEEAKLVATLNHPNIVQVFDFGRVGSENFIAMEYVHGANLATLLSRVARAKARLPVEVALYIAAEAARGLGYAHARTDTRGKPLNIVHRDVSPQNILLSFGGDVKVGDFGIAKMESAVTRTGAGQVRGKLSYMSPEQAAGIPLDGRSDLFSLGVVLYEMLAGKRLHAGYSGDELYTRVLDFRVPEDELARFPELARAALETALHRDPAQRFRDGVEMEGALSGPLGVQGIIQARQALASMLTRLVEDPEKAITGKSDVRAVAPTNSPVTTDTVASPTAADFSGSGGGEAATAGFVGPGMVVDEGPTQTGLSSSNVLTVGPSRSVVERPVAPPPKRATALPIVPIALFAVILAVVSFFAADHIRAPKPATDTPPATTAADATPVQTPLVDATVPPPVASHTPKPRISPARVAAAGVARLSVSAKPWVEVWLDGHRIATDTPLHDAKIPAGSHVVRFVHPDFHFSKDVTIDFRADTETKLFVDVKAGTVTTER